MGKMDRGTRNLILGIAGMFLIAFISGLWIVSRQPFESVGGEVEVKTITTGGGGATTTGETVLCAGDPNPTVSIQAVNKLFTSAIDYISGNTNKMHFRDLADTTGTQVDYTINGSNSASKASGQNAICSHSYDIVIETYKDVHNGAYFSGPFKLLAGGQLQSPEGVVSSIIKLNNLTTVQARVKDLELDAYVRNATLDGIGTNPFAATNWVDLGTAGDANFTSTTNSSICKTISADENTKADFQIELQGKSSYGVFGIKSLFGLDYTDETRNNDWQEPDLYVNGVKKSSIKSSLSADDIIATVKYDVIADMGKTVGAGEIDYVRLKAKTGAGTNPQKDLEFKVFATGIVESSKNPNSYLGVDSDRIFGDDASRTEISTATAQTGIICIE